jgi:hypothetical protein
MNGENQNEQSNPLVYVRGGIKTGVIIGLVGGCLYALSDFNTNKGSFLNLQTNLILFSCPLIGGLLGYVVWKLK